MDGERLADVMVITPVRHSDQRGFLSEAFNAGRLGAVAGIGVLFVQDNHSYSRGRGVVRGLHFQTPPAAQAKFVRITRGAILDVAVDLRQGSLTFGQHVAAELSTENWRHVWIPEGFAHGFCRLTEETEVLYKTTAASARGMTRVCVGTIPCLRSTGPSRRNPPFCRRRIGRSPCSRHCRRTSGLRHEAAMTRAARSKPTRYNKEKLR